jgi:Zn-dependent M28 family amino/carboxypeptidase
MSQSCSTKGGTGAVLSQSVIDGLADAAATYSQLKVQTSLHPFNSDPVSFLDANIPAVLTIERTDDANHHIHTANDTLAHINFDLAVAVLRMNLTFVAQAIGKMP